MNTVKTVLKWVLRICTLGLSLIGEDISAKRRCKKRGCASCSVADQCKRPMKEEVLNEKSPKV